MSQVARDIGGGSNLLFDGGASTRVVDGRTQRLLGAAPCEEEGDLPAAAVMAVLDASNRVLGRALT
jgi:hypothetical protein